MPRALVTALVLTVAAGPGCAYFRVSVPEPDPATEYEERTVHAFLWGLIDEETVAEDCKANTLDEVRAGTSLAHALATVATLGIWTPMRVQWRCSKPPAQTGEI